MGRNLAPGRDRRPAAMAAPDLPRWIDLPTVDSQAMLSAFLGYRDLCSPDEAAELEELFCIDHAVGPTVTILGRVLTPELVPGPTPTVPCAALGCTRCLKYQGGYQFRWGSTRWAAVYRRNGRAGCWVPEQQD